MTTAQKERQRALVVPREHGAWGMLLIPLVTGAALGLLHGGRWLPISLLTTAVLGLFWLRTPLESWLGTGVMRAQTPAEKSRVVKFVALLAIVVAGCTAALFRMGLTRQLLLFAVIASVAFGAQLVLKRWGRATRMFSEIVGASALTLTAAAAYSVSVGRLDAKAWGLWLVNWLFASDQVHFVWVRIRGTRADGLKQKLSIGWSFLAGQVALVAVLATALYFRWIFAAAVMAFLPILVRGCAWFARKPEPLAVRRLGWTEMAHAVVFGVLLVAGDLVLSRL